MKPADIEMEYQLVNGFREGSTLLYVPEEKKLYVLKVQRDPNDENSKEYICYQTILSAPKKNNQNNNELECTTRVKLQSNGLCVRNMPHTCHNNHEDILHDMEKSNDMKTKAKILNRNFPLQAHRISTREIFQSEYVK